MKTLQQTLKVRKLMIDHPESITLSTPQDELGLYWFRSSMLARFHQCLSCRFSGGSKRCVGACRNNNMHQREIPGRSQLLIAFLDMGRPRTELLSTLWTLVLTATSWRERLAVRLICCALRGVLRKQLLDMP